MLVCVTTAQATHVCGVLVPESGPGASLHQPASAGTPCLTCLMAQPTTLPVLFSAIPLLLLRKRRAAAGHAHARSFLQCFDLYVRPPPAY